MANTQNVESSVVVHEMFVNDHRISLRASPAFVALIRSKMKHGEAFTGIDSLVNAGSGWWHLRPRHLSKDGELNLTATDRALLLQFAAQEIETLVNECEEAELRANPAVRHTVSGSNRVVLHLVGNLSSAQRPVKEPKLAEERELRQLENKFKQRSIQLRIARKGKNGAH